MSDVKLSGLAEEFIASFTTKKEGLIQKIEKLKDSNNFSEEIAQVSKEIQKLSKGLHDVTCFLPSYSIKKRQEDIRELETLLKEQEDTLIPKKRFGFKQKFTNGKVKNEVVQPAAKLVDVVDAEQNGKCHGSSAADANFVTIENDNSDVICKEEDSLNGSDVLVRNLEGKVIKLDGTPSTLRLSNLKNCILACGPVHTSVFVENCDDCKLYLCCQQLRTHSSYRTDIYLRVRARAIIEDCSELRFAPYNYDHAKLEEWHRTVDIDPNLESFDCVDDFNWLSSSQSPNWTIMPEPERRAFDIFHCTQGA